MSEPVSRVKRTIRRLGVVIPVHNEENGLAECLDSVCVAARAVAVPTTIVIVLDECRDGSERICRSYPVEVVSLCARSVGIARHAGIQSFLRDVIDAEASWVANTDADTLVPVTWLRDQLELAALGVDAVVGTVELAGGSSLHGEFERAYASGLRGGEHVHVHGANMGFRASAYLRSGGFPPLALHEDRTLLRRLERAGVSIVRTTRVRVETSGRLQGRCAGGFASALKHLELAS